MRRIARPRALAPILALVPAFAALVAWRFDMTTGAFRNSDDSGNELAGLDLVHGNWNGHGWVMASDNYWPTDVLFTGLLSAVFGNHPILMKLEQALVWAAIGLIGTALACAGMARRHVLPTACLALAMLSFNVFDHSFADVFVSSVASHGFTILLALAAFAVAVLRPALTPARAALLCAIETVGIFADPIFVIAASLPLLALGLLGLAGPGGPARRTAAMRIAATVAALVLARVAMMVLVRSGGFTTAPYAIHLVPFARLPDHLAFAAGAVTRLLGAQFAGRPVGPAAAIFLARLPLVLAVALALAAVARGLYRRILDWPRSPPDASPVPGRARDLEHLLWLGTVLTAAAACVTDVIVDQSCARFFYPAAVMGAVLAARRFGRVPLAALYGVLILPLSIAAGLRAIHATPASTMVIPQLDAVLAVLAQRHLAHGYAGYFEGTIVTAMSRGTAESLPLVATPQGLRPCDWFVDRDRFRAAARDWHGRVFFIVSTVPGSLEIAAHDVAAMFGPPAETVHTGLFDVEIYDLAPGRLAALRP